MDADEGQRLIDACGKWLSHPVKTFIENMALFLMSFTLRWILGAKEQWCIALPWQGFNCGREWSGWGCGEHLSSLWKHGFQENVLKSSLRTNREITIKDRQPCPGSHSCIGASHLLTYLQPGSLARHSTAIQICSNAFKKPFWLLGGCHSGGRGGKAALKGLRGGGTWDICLPPANGRTAPEDMRNIIYHDHHIDVIVTNVHLWEESWKPIAPQNCTAQPMVGFV